MQRGSYLIYDELAYQRARRHGTADELRDAIIVVSPLRTARKKRQ
jgi:hypothetical protein